jgi:hypothetical protein
MTGCSLGAELLVNEDGDALSVHSLGRLFDAF